MRLFLILALFLINIDESHARRRKRSSSNSDSKSRSGGGWENAFGLLYTSYKVRFNELTNTPSSGSAFNTKLDFEHIYENAAAFSIETRSIENNSWGTVFGLEYLPKRDLNEIKINSFPPDTSENDTSEKCKSNCPSIQTTNLYLNTFYQWESFYIPFGILYGLHSYKSNGISPKIKNSVGFNLGFGFKIEDRYLIEINSRSQIFNLSYDDDDNSKTEIKGLNSIVSLGIKVLF
jgi:hypothetical protein